MSQGFSFGKTTAAPAFGTGSITFGTPAAAVQPQPAATGGFQFSSTAASTPNLFGAALTTTANTNNTTFGNLSGGTNLFNTTMSNVPNTGLTFGTPASNVQNTGLTFGTPATSTAQASTPGGLSFIKPAASAVPTGGLTFGTPAATSAPTAGLSFGLSSAPTTQTSTFGATQATLAPTLGSSFGAIATAAPTFGGFGTTAASTTGGLSFGLGTTNTTITAGGLSLGLGGAIACTAPTLNLSTASTAAPVLGLGGVATSQAKTTVTTHKEVPPKEQPLPNEIFQTVEQFKEMVKQQKAYSSDIARCSIRDFRKVEQEIDLLNNSINQIESQLHKNRHIAEKLKYDTAKSLQNIEMAQRTHDTPPGLQYENTAPLKFFLDLADQFEREMQALKMQIESADKYVKNYRTPDSLTPQDLAMGMRRLHETFVALAGRLQSVHSQVESQKEFFLNIRKHVCNDTSNPFEKLTKPAEISMQNLGSVLIYSPPKVATGPTPFSNFALGNANSMTQQHTTPPPAYPGTSANTAPTGFGSTSFGNQLVGSQPSNTSLFGNTNFSQSTFNSSFQLQKPPTGNKRGKV